jgi:hypothetical protein
MNEAALFDLNVLVHRFDDRFLAGSLPWIYLVYTGV